MTYHAAYQLDGGTASLSDQTYAATADDTSGVWVSNSGALTLSNPTIKTSGNTSSQDNSSFYGLNAGLLVTSGGTATVTGGTITTTGTGANGAFATGTGSAVVLNGVTINAAADGGHGVMATLGGTVTLTGVTIITAGASSGAIATDRGGGTISATGGTVTTSGMNSPAIYSTGAITVSGAAMQATGAEAAVIEGANSITLTDTSLASTKEKWGVMIYQSMSGDAAGTQGVFTMTGGSLNYTPASGPVFYVTNSTGLITLKGVTVTSNSPTLVSAAAGNWGNAGSNGGNAVLTVEGQVLAGNLTADSSSSIDATLKNNSNLTGTITNAALTLDGTSVWSVTGNSVLTSLSDADGIAGSSMVNIRGNGYTVSYDARLAANSYLGGRTYTLANGGTLAPGTGTSTGAQAPTIAAAGVANAASGAAGVAPGAWISISGSHLATGTATAASASQEDGYLPTTLGGVSVTIDGKPAYISYVSPARITVQAPAAAKSGTVTVAVTSAGGSATAEAKMQAVLPGLFTASNYVLAVRPDDGTVIDGTGTSVARPGDVLEIYGTGLGSTTGAVAPGRLFSGSYETTARAAVTIGGTPADVSYCRLVRPGLYRIQLTVPADMPGGTYPVVVTQSGVSSPATAMLKIAAR